MFFPFLFTTVVYDIHNATANLSQSTIGSLKIKRQAAQKRKGQTVSRKTKTEINNLNDENFSCKEMKPFFT